MRRIVQRPLQLKHMTFIFLLLLLLGLAWSKPQAFGQTTGANLALNKPAAASSVELSSLAPSQAVDGNAGTRWSSVWSDPQWISVDLGATYSINRVVLRWETAYGRAYQIQVSSDGSSWQTIYQTGSGDGGVDDLTVSGSGRYIRMYGTARATQWGYSLWEFEVYGSSSATPTPTTGGVNVAAARPVSSPSTIQNAGRITDGDKNTANYAGLDLGLRWIQIDLGQSYSIDRIRLWHYFGDGRSYRDVIVQLSNSADFSSRTTVFNNDSNNSAGQGFGSDAEYAESSAGRELSFPAVSARYVRLWSNGSSANQYNHYVEVEVFSAGGTTPNPTPTPTPPPSTGVPPKVVGGYWPFWPSSPIRIRDVHPGYNIIYLFSARPVGGSPGTTGEVYWSTPGDGRGAATHLVEDIQYARTVQGRRIILSVGGAGYGMSFPDRTKSQNFVNSIVRIYNDLGGIDGLDWNTFEADQAPDTEEMMWISLELKRRYPGFIITAPPAPWNSRDKEFCRTMVQAGAMDYCAPQYYDGPNLANPDYVVDSINEWVGLVGAEHLVVGFGINPGVTNYMTVEQAVETWNRVEANHPGIRGGFVWQIHTDEAQGWVFPTRLGPLITQ